MGLIVALVAFGCRDVDSVSFVDAWFHATDAGAALNIRFGLDGQFTLDLEGCDNAGILHTSWVWEGLAARVSSLPGSPLFQPSPFADMLESSVPVTFGGAPPVQTFVRGGLCPVCSGADVVGVAACPSPLRDGGT
jgi:hypothetical protein